MQNIPFQRNCHSEALDESTTTRKLKTQIISAMRFTAMFLFAIVLTVSAETGAQLVTINKKEVPLQTVLKDIETQTSYGFFYNASLEVKFKPVTVNVTDMALNQALKLVMQNQVITYEIVGKTIVLQERRSKTIESPQPPSSIVVKGRVVNSSHEGLIATITVKGTKRSITTNDQGEFNLEVIDSNDILVISAINIETLEIPVNGRTHIPYIIVETKVTILDETIIQAYGTTTRRLNTGNIGKVRKEEIERQPVSNPIATLQGRISGVLVTQSSGLPGSSFKIQIRGKNSIQQGSDPLFIIDGVPFISENLTQRSLTFTNNPFNSINPADIESIEVLKDADATAIYGSRGAGGVILITTKKARAGKVNISASLYSGWGNITRKVDLMNTQQYVAMRKEAFLNDGVTPTLANAFDILAWDSTRQTNWQDLLIGGTAKSRNASVRISGGSFNTKLAAGVNYYREETVFPGNKWADKVTFNYTGSHNLPNNKFSIEFAGLYGFDHSRLPRQDLTSSIFLSPTAPGPYDSSGNLKWSENGFSFSNPFAKLEEEYEGRTEMLNASLTMNYSFLQNCRLRASGGFNTVSLEELSLLPIIAQDPNSSPNGSANSAFNKIRNWIIEPQLDYTNKLSKNLNVHFLLGFTFQNKKSSSNTVDALGFTDDRFLRFYSSAPVIRLANSSSEYRYSAMYGRLNLNYKSKLILNISSRRDGSSRFGLANRWANFMAIGGAYIISQEKLIQNFKFVSFAKLRASYGSTGSDQIGDYQYLDSWTATTFPFPGSQSLQPARLANPDYGWEITRKAEIALELTLFKNRLTTSISWYNNRSVNQIVYYPIPTQTGFNVLLQNFEGKVQNSGWEVDLSFSPKMSQNFEWKTSINLSIPRNRLIAFPGLSSTSYASSYVIGQPLNVIYGFRFLGVDSSTGIYSFEDLNKDGTLNINDYQVLGHTSPIFFGGLNNGFTYKNWSLDFLFQFVSQKGLNYNYSSSYAGGIANRTTALLDRWQRPGDIASFQKYSQGTGPASSAALRLSNSNAAYTDASFVRLKTVSIGYSVSKMYLNKLNIESASVYLRAQNLLTLTKFSGADPETQNQQVLPPLRMVVVGINVNL